MSDQSSPLVALAVGALLVAAGGFLYYSEQRATANAEEIEATILSSEVVDYEPGESVEDEDDYRASIEYRYTYQGETYTSTNLCPGQGMGCAPSGEDRSDAEAFVEQYPEGETVTAFVPPDDPSAAYLAEGGSPLLYLGLAGAGVIVMGLGVRQFF